MSMFGVAPQSRSLGSREDQDDQGNTTMPWTGKQFKARHNKSASPSQAASAARQATAMVNEGVDEGIAIATAKRRHMRGSKMPLPDLIMRRMGDEMDAGLHAGERAGLGNTQVHDQQHAMDERARQTAKYSQPPQHGGGTPDGGTLGDILSASLRNDGRQAAASGNANRPGDTWSGASGI
jgi:hypothetical protein